MSSSVRLPLLALLPTLLVAATAVAAPPPEVTDRLERGLNALAADSFVGTYTLTAKATVAKPDGSDREDSLDVHEVSRSADGTTRTRVIRAERDGKDTTAEKQREVDEKEKRTAAATTDGKPAAKREVSVSLVLPAGEHLASFTFGEPRRVGSLLVVAFEPKKGATKKDGLSRGQLAWHAENLDPAWVEAQPDQLPRMASRLHVRIELARTGELLYPRRTVTDGAGGMLWIKRTFEAEVTIDDVRIGEPAS